MVDNNNQKTIFITLAACQEYFLEHTIKSAIAMAEYPDRIHFGVFNQIMDKKYSLLNNEFLTNNRNILYAEIISQYPLGVGYGRMNASLLSKQNHDFMFQTDAHAIFTKNWDSILIDKYYQASAEHGTNKVVFSAAVGGWFSANPNNRNVVVMHVPDMGEVSVDIFYDNNLHEIERYQNSKNKFHFNGVQGDNVNDDLIGFPIAYGDGFVEDGDYQETSCVNAAFVFGEYSLIRDVMHDPADVFHGDQTNYSIRLLSRGYRIFSIKYPAIAVLGKVLADHTLVDEEYNWRTQAYHNSRTDFSDIYSKQNYQNIVTGKYLGYWGAPDKAGLLHAKNKMGYNGL